MPESSRPLFRQAAQEAQRSTSFGEIVLLRPLSLGWMTGAAAAMALAVILLFALGGYTRRTTVDGVVVPDTGLVKVYAQQAGVVLRKGVSEGQHVARGQWLYAISSDLQSAAQGQTQAALIVQTRQRKQSLLQEIEKTRVLQHAEGDTLSARITSLTRTLAEIDSQIASQQTRTALAADGVKRYRELLAQDYISHDQAQQREADWLDQQSRLAGLARDRASTAQALKEANTELAGLNLRQQNQLAQLDRSVIDVDQSLIESEARRELLITAPEAGLATAMIAEPGQMLDTSHPAASIVPADARWQVYLFVPSAAVGFVQIGQAVRVRYQAFPYQKFGQYQARVSSIAHTALSAAELASSGSPPDLAGGASAYYRVTARLDAQQVTAYGQLQSLQAGMALQADILQEHRRLYEWVLEPLYSLTGKL